MGAWNTPWQGALRAMARGMIGAVREADTWVRHRVTEFPRKSDIRLWHDATRLAWRIAQPEYVQKLLPGQPIRIPGDTRGLGAAKAVWTIVQGKATLTGPRKRVLILPQGTKLICGDFATHIDIQVKIPGVQQTSHVQVPHGTTAEITTTEPTDIARWECGCGHQACAERHRLAAWDPAAMVERTRVVRNKDGQPEKVKDATPLTLWNFVASAVKGPRQPIKTGSFPQGMYFPLLTEEEEVDGKMTKLRFVPVEFKVCCCGKTYEGEICPKCRQAFDPQRMRKLAYDRIIRIQEDPAAYTQTERCRCRICKNLFDLQAAVVASAQCPACRSFLFPQEALKKQRKTVNAATLLKLARQLESARQQLSTACPSCGEPVPTVCWCPWCRTQPDAETRCCVPQRLTTVWVRTSFERTAIGQVGKQRKKGGGRRQHEGEGADYAQDSHA
jgi:hypothetical protein